MPRAWMAATWSRLLILKLEKVNGCEAQGRSKCTYIPMQSWSGLMVLSVGLLIVRVRFAKDREGPS